MSSVAPAFQTPNLYTVTVGPQSTPQTGTVNAVTTALGNVSIKSLNNQGITQLTEASKIGNLDTVKCLEAIKLSSLKRKIYLENTNLYSIFLSRATMGLKELKDALLEQRLTVPQADPLGVLPLAETAAYKDDHILFNYLIIEGANINSYNYDKETPLYAVVKGLVETKMSGKFAPPLQTLNFLIKNGANVNSKNCTLNDSPLHLALQHGKLDMAASLLNNGADVLAENDLGNTPLKNVQDNKLYKDSIVGSPHRKIHDLVQSKAPRNFRSIATKAAITGVAALSVAVFYYSNYLDCLSLREDEMQEYETGLALRAVAPTQKDDEWTLSSYFSSPTTAPLLPELITPRNCSLF